jgi:hypothetical protein
VLHEPCAGHQAVDLSRTCAGASGQAETRAIQFNADAELLADQLFDRYVGSDVLGKCRAVGGLQSDCVFEEFAQRFVTVK